MSGVECEVYRARHVDLYYLVPGYTSVTLWRWSLKGVQSVFIQRRYEILSLWFSESARLVRCIEYGSCGVCTSKPT